MQKGQILYNQWRLGIKGKRSERIAFEEFSNVIRIWGAAQFVFYIKSGEKAR